MNFRMKLLGFSLLAMGLMVGQRAEAQRLEGKELPPDAELGRLTVKEAFTDTEPQAEDDDKHGKPPVEFVPTVPVLVDGVLYSPEELEKHGIKVVRFLLDEESEAKGTLRGFTNAASLQEFLVKQGRMPTDEPQSPRAASCPSYFYEHWYYGGNWFNMHAGSAYPWLGSWNNRISSVSTTCASWTVLYSLPFYVNQQLWIGRYTNVPELGRYGYWRWWWGWKWRSWNDNAMSVAVFW
jgi:hypothetical protein